MRWAWAAMRPAEIYLAACVLPYRFSPLFWVIEVADPLVSFISFGQKHRTRQHTAGDVSGLEPVLQEDPRRVVGPLGRAAEYKDLAVAGEFAEAGAEFGQRDVDRARHRLHGKFRRIAYIEKELAVQRVPVADRHVSAEDIGRDHPGKVDRVLGAPVRRRVAKLSLFQVVDGQPRLDGHGEGIDPFGNTVLAEHLCPEKASV